MDNLLITIAKTVYNVRYDKNNHSTVFVDDKPFEVELMRSFGSDVFSFLVNQKIFQVGLDFDDNSKLELTLNGLSYKIEVTDEMHKVLDKYISLGNGGTKGVIGIVKAPMPGLVVKTYVKEGMQVIIDDKLIVIEAMKMENTLKSPANGIVKSINVIEGQAVEKGAVLIEIEPTI